MKTKISLLSRAVARILTTKLEELGCVVEIDPGDGCVTFEGGCTLPTNGCLKIYYAAEDSSGSVEFNIPLDGVVFWHTDTIWSADND